MPDVVSELKGGRHAHITSYTSSLLLPTANFFIPDVGPDFEEGRHAHITAQDPSMSCSLFLYTANFSIPFARPDFQSITFAATSGGVDSGLAGQQLVVGRTWLDRQKKRSVSEGQEQQGAKQVRGGGGEAGLGPAGVLGWTGRCSASIDNRRRSVPCR